MENKNKPIVALCYDFDMTLSPKNMQEFGLFQNMGLNEKDFFEDENVFIKEKKVDRALAFMFKLIQKSKKQGKIITKQDLINCGKNIEFYPGVETWFKRINEFAEKNDVIVEHYVISAGLEEIVEACSIAKEFKQIYASRYIYDENDIPFWPAYAINYTSKTQYLYRINKGVLEKESDSVNEKFADETKRIPFSNMLYFGDSFTDIPCMAITKKSGGYAIGVYDDLETPKTKMQKLIKEGRINFFAPTDYTENSQLDIIVKDIILKIKYDHSLKNVTNQLLSE